MFGKSKSRNVANTRNAEDMNAQIVQKISSAVMAVDRDFIVTFVNEPTRELLKRNEKAFEAVWPNFKADNIIGTCIDTFHKNPSHQRQLLADPSRLPIRTEITIRDLKVALLVNGVFDSKGGLVGHILEWRDVTAERLHAGMLEAISKSQAVIEFALDGTVQNANANFLNALGYSLEEIKGQHHSIFVEPAYKQSPEYRLFWEKLGRGEYDAGQYKRIGKGGKEIWIQASYNPILDANGKAFKVVKYATDVTASVKASQALQHAVSQTQEVVDAAKANDLTHRIPLQGKVGEIQSLCAGVNGLLDTMATVIVKIKSSAREVSNASSEISMSTTDLSQRTEEQAASLEETSASMEEMSATVKKNAENAQQANQSAAATQGVADRGGQVVAQAVDAMARIEESSRKISDIIGVIDEIARQTNLLALNAAVEAARAGEAGRGFAVVASEVRSLAQRSSQAAKDIKDLITKSNSQVKDGVDLVNKAGAALTEIVDSIKKVAAVVSDIASASAEQAAGIEQVNKALTQMDEVTQQNSALVEENAATAKTLEHQSKAMNEEVSVFRVGDADDHGAQGAHKQGARERPAPAAKTPAAKASPAKTAAPAAEIKPAPAKPAAAKNGAAAPAGGGPARRMQAALATAVAVNETQWQEF